MSQEFLKELKNTFEGEIKTDPVTRNAYSVDASIYEIQPLAVAVPKNKEDVSLALKIASHYRIPVTARGAATSITGGCLGAGLVLDLSQHLNQILEINPQRQYAICQPGVVQDQLNAALFPYGYRLGPDTSTGNRATIGGMLANNSAGAHSLLFGCMADHTLGVELALADGSRIDLKETETNTLSQASSSLPLQAIYQNIDSIRNEYRDDILANFPKIPRRVSGYNLHELTKKRINLSRLIAGSEGTLGIATEITLGIVPLLRKSGLCLVHCHDMVAGLHAVPNMLEYKPISLEMIDDRIISASRQTGLHRNRPDLIQDRPQALFIAEFEEPGLLDKLDAFQRAISQTGIGYAIRQVTAAEDMQHIWGIRKAGLGLLLSKRTYSRAIAFIEDLSIPPGELASFIKQFKAYLKTHNKEAGIYGHVGAGCMHIRPYIDLRDPQELQLMQQMMLDISSLVLEYKGALSGEHGDGLIRTWLNKKMFGPRLYQAFCEIKSAFDPHNQLNPGKIVDGPPLLQNLRIDPEIKIQEIDTFQDFSKEGGFALAADLCNGNALCRKREGLMCPSFQATGNEYDTTRARAQALRAIINGRWKIEDFTSPQVGAVLDLCLECKGCKSECPSHVDMAKMKSEYLYHYQERHGYFLRSRLFGHISKFYQIAQPLAGWHNTLVQTRIVKSILSLFGIAPQRTLPLLAKKRFSSTIKSKPAMSEAPKPDEKTVVLFNDTFTEFNQPEIGHAAYHILSKLGYSVVIPPWKCCGRPLISKGLLREARAKAELLVAALYPYAATGACIVGLEPSCILSIMDDFPALVSEEFRQKAQAVAEHCLTFDQFLQKQLVNGRLPLDLQSSQHLVKVHGHCHQKALVGMQPTLEVLRSISGLQVQEIPSGCCGMAGSFGYEKEHYEISLKIAALQLFPSIQINAEEVVLANGFSCRNQIMHGKVKALHLAEFLFQLTRGS